MWSINKIRRAARFTTISTTLKPMRIRPAQRAGKRAQQGVEERNSRGPEVRGVRRTHHGQQGPKRCLVGNTETMKGTGRVGRVNVTRKDSRNRECNQPSAAALTNGCAQEKQKTKTKTNVLDGADFVRDVLDTYP